MTTAEEARRKTGSRLVAAWNAVTALVGGVIGLLPHLLHHVGLLGGAVLVTGATGNVLFAVLGLVFSFPLLRRLYRRFGTWKAPALALAIFALMFSLSAFVIGPAISDDSPSPDHDRTPVQPPAPDDTTTTRAITATDARERRIPSTDLHTRRSVTFTRRRDAESGPRDLSTKVGGRHDHLERHGTPPPQQSCALDLPGGRVGDH